MDQQIPLLHQSPQGSNDGKMEKMDNCVPKKKVLGMGMGHTSSPSQPPAKRVREGSPGGGSPASSGPGSARSPGLDQVGKEL